MVALGSLPDGRDCSRLGLLLGLADGFRRPPSTTGWSVKYQPASRTGLGPSRVGGRFGWLQSPADGLEAALQRRPDPGGKADRFLFRLAPYISFCAAFAPRTSRCHLPTAGRMPTAGRPSELDTAVFFILAVVGPGESSALFLGGYSSGSKWSLFGAMRRGGPGRQLRNSTWACALSCP